MSQPTNPAIISYLTLRKAVGVLGISFPVVMALGSFILDDCHHLQNSISAYYHTNMHDLFVGILCAIALFLFAYKGYHKMDAIAGDLAGFFALGVAFFPTSVTGPLTHCLPAEINEGPLSTVHFISSAGLFFTLSFFSIFLFTKTGGNPTPMKHKRNKLYRVCGFIMLGSILFIGIFSICRHYGKCQFLNTYDPTFWLETVALATFGISWLTKGKTILPDK